MGGGLVCISGWSLVCGLNPGMYVNTKMRLERGRGSA